MAAPVREICPMISSPRAPAKLTFDDLAALLRDRGGFDKLAEELGQDDPYGNGARATLGDLQHATPWVWVYCNGCSHHSPLACAVPVIRWGADTSSDKLRRCARCTACGQKGATIQHPGWGGSDVGARIVACQQCSPTALGKRLGCSDGRAAIWASARPRPHCTGRSSQRSASSVRAGRKCASAPSADALLARGRLTAAQIYDLVSVVPRRQYWALPVERDI
jgi:hypothetical protein